MSHLCEICREEWTTVGIHVRGRWIPVGQACAEKIADLYDRRYKR